MSSKKLFLIEFLVGIFLVVIVCVSYAHKNKGLSSQATVGCR